MASLNEHNQSLDKRLTKHLLRRACFQYSKAQLDDMTGKTPAEILAQLTVSKSYAWNWPNDPVTNGSGANLLCANNQDGFWLMIPIGKTTVILVGRSLSALWLLDGGGITP